MSSGRTLRYVACTRRIRDHHPHIGLLDLYPAGPVLNVAGAKTLICWERLVLCDLVED